MEISYYIFLIIYGLGVLFFIIYSLINIFHISRFGFFDSTSIFMVIFYVGISLAIFLISYQFMSPIPWAESLVINLPSISL